MIQILDIVFLSLGILSGIIQLFIEKGGWKKTLISISLISFIGLGVIDYISGIQFDNLQTQFGGLKNQFSAVNTSSSALEAETAKLKNQVFAPSPKTQIIVVSSTDEGNDIYNTELSFGIGTVAGASMPTLVSISTQSGIICGPLSGPSTPGFTALGPLAGLMQVDWTTNCTSTGAIPTSTNFRMKYQ